MGVMQEFYSLTYYFFSIILAPVDFFYILAYSLHECKKFYKGYFYDKRRINCKSRRAV